MDKIRILIASDVIATEGYYTNIFSSCEDIKIVAEVNNGENAIKKTEQLLPDVLIVDLNMSSMDGITVAEKVISRYPSIPSIIISDRKDLDYFKKAMQVGAKDYLVKPFLDDELTDAIRRVFHAEKKRSATLENSKKSNNKQKYKMPQVVTVFGTKGGAGKTTLSVNLAVQVVKETMKKVVLVDLDLQFGDVAVFLNLLPKKGIAELVQERNKVDIDLIESYLIPHMSGIKILPAPIRPEDSELITAENVLEILTVLRDHYDYVIIDTPPFFHETTLSALDISNQIILIMSMDLPAVKNMRLSLDLLDTMHHKDKSKLVLNRASEDFGITPQDVENTLEFYISNLMPSDGKLVVRAANRGIPFVMNKTSSKISRAIEDITKMVIEDNGYQKDLEEMKKKRSIFKLFR